MRTLVHLSDLHFGAIAPATLEPLKACVEGIDPDVLVVSGDLTQRARSRQFRAARDFLAQLPHPQVVVPGNHDVPLYDVLQRFFTPLRRYRRNFSRVIEPEYADAELVVVGVNTARSSVFKGGRINEEQVARVQRVFAGAPETAVRVVVTHHPLHVPDDWDEENQEAGRSRMALESLAAAGADVYLSGHLHRTHSGGLELDIEAPVAGPLVVAAGTATSTRSRTETNRFNVLRIARETIRVEAFEWKSGESRFACEHAQEFRRTGDGWRKVAP